MPYCNLHLRGFQRALPELQQFGAQIVAISPQLPDNSLNTQEKDELTFAVLSEVGNKVARRFGIVFQIGEATPPSSKDHEKENDDEDDNFAYF